MENRIRPSWDDYYMNMAWDASTRSNCQRRPVGALIVVKRSIVSTGYNGTPFGVKNCTEGGCPRCASDAPRHQGYETCLCVHAEQNAVLLAARHGTATNLARLYVTLRPCFGCLKEVIQAGIQEIVYDQPFDYDGGMERVYQTLLVEAGVAMRQHPYSATHLLSPLAISASQDTGPEMPAV
jgi:dCMP deaminase